MLMGMRGAKHRFMPNRLVFPGGRVDRADLRAPFATPLSPAHRTRLAQENQRRRWRTAWPSPPRANCRRKPACRLGSPPRLDGLHYLARAVTPPGSADPLQRPVPRGGGTSRQRRTRWRRRTRGFALLRHDRGAGAATRAADTPGAGAAGVWLALPEPERNAPRPHTGPAARPRLDHGVADPCPHVFLQLSVPTAILVSVLQSLTHTSAS